MPSLPPPSPLPYRNEPMQADDIPHVMAIERRVFSLAWSSGVYQRELASNPWSHYQVLRATSEALPPILAYGGVWQMADEAHIPTIAAHPQFAGLGLGSCMLLHLLIEGCGIGCELATLEVRISNLAAQRLYLRHGFMVAGRRRRYYNDNGEDALIMTRPELKLGELQVALTAAQHFLLGRWPHPLPPTNHAHEELI